MQEFLADIDLMCKNAKTYNDEDSEVYSDAIIIQKHAHKLVEKHFREQEQKRKALTEKVPASEKKIKTGTKGRGKHIPFHLVKVNRKQGLMIIPY